MAKWDQKGWEQKTAAQADNKYSDMFAKWDSDGNKILSVAE